MQANKNYKLLLVDDDPALLKVNRAFFEQHGYEVVCAANARAAVQAVTTARLDCVVLDIDLPDENGFEVCVAIRKSTNLPIIFLSAYTEEESRVRGLSIGGDDYICKPCSLTELALRVRLRIESHPQEHTAQVLRFGSLVIDPEQRIVSYLGRTADLTRIEFDILYYLARNPERVYSYDQLYDRIWHEPLNLGRHSVQVRVGAIRKKLFAVCPDREFIHTIRHSGYQFVPGQPASAII